MPTMAGANEMAMPMLKPANWSETITVVGTGAVGRQVAVSLAALGAKKLQLIDGDVVRRKHIETQAFLADDVGRPKVHATADICQQVSPRLALEELNSHLSSRMTVGAIVFCCMERKVVRSTLLDSISEQCQFWGESRLDDGIIRVTTDRCRRRGGATELNSVRASNTAGQRLPNLPLAMIAASILVHQFTRFSAGLEFDREIELDLARGTFVRRGSNG